MLLAIAVVSGRPGTATLGRSLAACEIEDETGYLGIPIVTEPALLLELDQTDRRSAARACSAACSGHRASYFTYDAKQSDNCWCNWVPSSAASSAIRIKDTPFKTPDGHPLSSFSSGRTSQECFVSSAPASCEFKTGYVYQEGHSFAAYAPSIHQCSALCATHSEVFTFRHRCWCKSSNSIRESKPTQISGTASTDCSAEAASPTAAPAEATTAAPAKTKPTAAPTAAPEATSLACEIEDGIDYHGSDIAAEPALPLDHNQLDRASAAKACSAACSVHGASHFSYSPSQADNCWCNLSNEPRTSSHPLVPSILHLSSGRASRECSVSPAPASCDFKTGYAYPAKSSSFKAYAPSIHQCSALCAAHSEVFTFGRRCWCKSSNSTFRRNADVISGTASADCSAEAAETCECDADGVIRGTVLRAAGVLRVGCALHSGPFYGEYCYVTGANCPGGKEATTFPGVYYIPCSQPTAPPRTAAPSAAPTEAAPTEAAPTEAAPTEAAPTEAAPTEAAPEATPAPEKPVALAAAVPEDDGWKIGAGVGGVVLLGCLCAGWLWTGESGLGAYFRRAKAMRKYRSMIQDACTDALRSGKFASPGGLFQPPAELPQAQQLKKVLGSPEDLLAVGDDTFKCTVEAAIVFIDDYISAAERWWTLEDIRSVATAKIGNAFVDAYSSVHELIKVKEEDGYKDFQDEIAKNVRKLVPYEALLDQIPDKAERITKLYAEAAQVLPHFTKLVEQVAESVGGSALVAPLKSPLRVIEKMALRPEKGVPWDIVRAQVQVNSMAKVGEATSLITRSLETDVHRIKDRFSSPHEGGWADCSMNITMGYAWDSAATVKTSNTLDTVILVGTNTRSEATKANAPKLGACSAMCEIQVVHEYLMMVREGMKQHDAYDHGRFAAELLTTKGGGFTPPLPWSVREKIEPFGKLGRKLS